MNLYNFDAGCVVGNDLFFSSNSINGLYRKNLINESVDLIGEFYGEDIDRAHLHHKCLRWKGYIIFLPCLSSYIHIYDLVENKMKYIKVESQKYDETYADGCVYDDTLYLFPNDLSHDLFIYDLYNEVVIEDDFFNISCLKFEKYKKGEKFNFNRICQKNEIVCIPTKNAGVLIKVDLVKRETEAIDIGIEQPILLTIFDDKWVGCTNRNDIIFFNCEWEVERMIENNLSDNDEIHHEVMSISVVKDDLIILPGHEKCIYRFNFLSYEMQRMDVDMGENYDLEDYYFYGYGRIDDKIIIFPRNSEYCILLGEDGIAYKNFDGSMEKYKDKFPTHFEKFTNSLTKNQIIAENDKIGLKEFLTLI